MKYQNIKQAKAIEYKNKKRLLEVNPKLNELDLSNERYGRLVVIERADDKFTKDGKRIKQWLCKCDCGNEKITRQQDLRSGHTTSCGCYHKEMVGRLNRKHNLSHKSHLYNVWKSMKDRCYREKCKSYPNYGGRGITVCDEWKQDYKSFYDWSMANGYREEQTIGGVNILSIDRIDNDGNYGPDNCRWVTSDVQAMNRRTAIPKEQKYSICPVCGKDYIKTQRNGEKTCSRSCGIKLYYLEHPNLKDYTKICPICKKKFDAKRGGHYNDAVYCSNECRNKSFSPIWEYNGESLRVVEWAKKIGINAHCLLHRKEMGWTIEEILTTPLRGRRNAKT